MSPLQSRLEQEQKLRLQRLFMSVSMYVITIIPQLLTYFNGMSPGWIILVWAVFSLLVNLGFYLTIRSGLNLRLSDPSLTLAQMSAALIVALFVQIYSGPARGAYLMVLMLIMVFGCFKLATRQLLMLSGLTIVGYSLGLVAAFHIEGERFNPALEAVLWCSFTPFILCLSVLSGSISGLRRKLHQSNQKLEAALHQVTELASHDELTGLFNRRYLLEMLRHEKNRCDRGGAGFCLCVFDIDHFKRVNDQYGHTVGDAVLKGFADHVAPLLRSTDVFARYGGEEFLLFLPNTALDCAQQCVARIQVALPGMTGVDIPEGLNVTVSVGIAHYGGNESIDDLIRHADQALYRAKHAGRNRIELAAPC